jgi:hypothetical protein
MKQRQLIAMEGNMLMYKRFNTVIEAYLFSKLFYQRIKTFFAYNSYQFLVIIFNNNIYEDFEMAFKSII